jgi:hypothetical protein
LYGRPATSISVRLVRDAYLPALGIINQLAEDPTV